MTDGRDHDDGAAASGRVAAPGWVAPVAGLGLAAVGGVLLLQLYGDPIGGIAAAIGAGVVAGVLWADFVSKASGAVIGRAALIGALAMLVAALAARFTPWAVAATVPANVLLFSLWIVLPIGVAAAIGLALVLPRVGRG